MTPPPRVLVVDDVPANCDVLEAILAPRGYAVVAAHSGADALELVRSEPPDLVLLDVLMPPPDGYEVCRRLRDDPATSYLPVVMVTAGEDQERTGALEAGADDFIRKPFDPAELLARVRSLLRIKAYHDTIRAQAAELAAWNATLEGRVREQVAEVERLGRLRRFLAPQLAALIVSAEGESLLESHRREIAVLRCGLRGFAALTETAEPESVMRVLREYYAAAGALAFAFEGTVGPLADEGLLVFFNDPLPCPDPPGQAVGLALAMRDRMRELTANWRKRGHDLGFGVGLDLGYATLGTVGFGGRSEYRAVGGVVAVAARLCDAAGDGEIRASQRVHAAVEERVAAAPLGGLPLPGFLRPVTAFTIEGLTAAPAAVPLPAAVPGTPPPPAPPAGGPLSGREREVAVLIARGHTNREIAQELVIAEGTAVRHVANILNKLGLRSRAQVAVWAVERGLAAGTAGDEPAGD